jgi:hypothetical protein
MQDRAMTKDEHSSRPGLGSNRAPTERTYTDLNAAYDLLNVRLFGGELPTCLITMQRKRSCYGYFHARRFVRVEGEAVTTELTDEIALNPSYFHAGSTELLSTLLHEMVHLWQHHFGKPSRTGYHNREWAAKMRMVGLIPSSTGKPGGKETGQKVADYVDPDGPFARLLPELLGQGLGVAWIERGAAEAMAAEGGDGDGEEVSEPAPADPKKKRKYTCPSCEANAWGKPTLRLICADCMQPMTVVE